MRKTTTNQSIFPESTPLTRTGDWHYPLVAARTVQGTNAPTSAVLLQGFTLQRFQLILRIYEIGTSYSFYCPTGPTQWLHQSDRLIAPAGVRISFYRNHQPTVLAPPSIVCIPEVGATPVTGQGCHITGFVVESVGVTICADGYAFDGDVRGKGEDVVNMVK